MSMLLYLILTLLNITHLAMAKRSQATISMYTGKVKECSLEDMLNREILELSTGDTVKMECVRQCIRSGHCDAVVYQEFENGSTSCMTLSEVRKGNSDAHTLSASIVCKTVHIKPCRNGGHVNEGVCVCQHGFTGPACEYENPSVCDVEWMTAATKTNENFSFDATIAEEFGHTNAKLAIRNKKLNVLSVMKSTYSGTHFPKISGYWSFISFPYFEKESWNKFAANPFRKYIHAMSSGDVQVLNLNEMNGHYSFSKTTEYFSFIAPRQTRYTVKRNLPEDQDVVMNDIQNGFELFHSNRVNVIEEDGVIVAQLTDRLLNVLTGVQFLDPPIRIDFKFVLGKATYLAGFLIANGTLSGLWSTTYSKDVYLNPCWVDVPHNDVPDRVSSLASGWKRLGTYLRSGKDVRVKSGSTYHTVLETINVGDTFTFILAPYLTQKQPTPFTSGLHEIRSIITSSSFYQSCTHLVELEHVIANSQFQFLNDVEWFVDTRTWSQAFAVFSNSSVAHGSVSDLVSGVTEGRDVRIWIKCLNSGVSRFLDTHMSSVTDDGKVSTESLVTWQTTVDSEVHLSQNCDLQYVLATSDGHVEILLFNVHTPGVSEVQTDVLVTWFLA